MCPTRRNWPRGLILSVVYALAIAGVVASGGGGGNGASVSFPNPTLPDGAVTLNIGNAQDIAESAVEFARIISTIAQFKTAAPPTIPAVIKQVTDRIIERSRSSQPVVTGVTENLSSEFCTGGGGGTAIANYNESASSASGRITFTTCDIGLGILISGTVSFDTSWNDTTLAYDNRFGGTLSFVFGADTFTFVFDLSDTGNEGTGAFSSTIKFSLDGIPGGGFLVTTTQRWEGDFSGFTSGQFIVQGANNTRLRITVVPGNMADVELDEGSGFTYVNTIPLA